MLTMRDLQEGHVYEHDNHRLYAKLLRWVGDSESGGAVTVEIAGEITTTGLAGFMRKYNVIHVQELAEDAYKNQG